MLSDIPATLVGAGGRPAAGIATISDNTLSNRSYLSEVVGKTIRRARGEDSADRLAELPPERSVEISIGGVDGPTNMLHRIAPLGPLGCFAAPAPLGRTAGVVDDAVHTTERGDDC